MREAVTPGPTSMAEVLVCTGSKVLLPECADPVPATVIVDRSTGKIIDIRPSRISREQLTTFESVEWIDAADNIVLPGLVEYVISSSHMASDTLIFRSAVLMSTLMNRVVPHGKVSGLEPGLLLLGVSPPWSICL